MTLLAGLTPSGFVAPTFTQIVNDINAAILAQVNSGLDLSPSQPLGQIIGILSEKLAEAYQLGATVYNSLNPNAADGALLVNACALSGTAPQAATYSTVTCNLNLNASTTINTGSLISVTGLTPVSLWYLTAPVVSSTAGVYQGVFRSLNPGPFAAPAGSLTTIQVSTPGWNSVTNPAAATLGNAADSDATLRARRAQELLGQGSGDVDAIRAAVLKVPGIQPGLNSVVVTENTTLVTATDGTPGKSFHVIIWDNGMALSNAVAQAIWNVKPSGIFSFGVTAGTATDSIGNPHTVLFDRATQLPVYVSLTTTSPVALTSVQIAALKQAIVNYAIGTYDANGLTLTQANIVLGQNVVALALRGAVFTALQQMFPGSLVDVPTFALDFIPSPTNTANLTVGTTQIATFATANFLVNGV